MAGRRFDFPGGKRFAFTILDDTDDGTVANLTPIYSLLEELGMRTTKTVWPMPCPEGSRDFFGGQTLEDEDYRQFVLELARRGFEITWHGATMESSRRERTIAGLERYKETFGEYPRIHVNHASNQENLYWGTGRLDSTFLRAALNRKEGWNAEYYTGHVQGSQHWWGDRASAHFVFARNLTTNDINTARFNPSMPYRDPRRPLIPWWFSASDADDVNEFNTLISPQNQARLENEGGFCIVATHLGKRFVQSGAVNETTRQRLTELASRNGWFPTVGELLVWLRARREETGRSDGRLSGWEWRTMQWRWGLDRALHQISRSRKR